MTDLTDRLEHEMYAWLVGKYMTCPATGKVLDVRTAVVVEEADGIKTLGVFSPEGWAEIKDRVLAQLPTCRIVINGKVQERETT